MTFPIPVNLKSIGQQAPRVNALPIFVEDWSKVGYIDAAKWVWFLTSTGNIYNGQALNQVPSKPGLMSQMNLRCPGTNAGEGVCLTSRDVFIPGLYGQTALTTVLERVWFEFEGVLLNAATRVDNAVFFLGLCLNLGDVPAARSRASNWIIGWGLASDVLQAVADNGGTETVAALTSAPTLTALHTYSISLDRLSGARFFVDHVLQATITTNIPVDYGGRIFFNIQNDAATGEAFCLGMIHVWKEDII